MAQSEPVEIEEDQDVVGILCAKYGSVELRALASNIGVSRERGDTKGETAQKLVAQDPAVAARILENDRDNSCDCSPFKENREVGAEKISLDEAMKRARHKKMYYKLKHLSRAISGLPGYEAEVKWEYSDGTEPGLTSIIVKRADDAPDVHWILDERVHILLTAHGRCTMLDIGDSSYIDRNTPKPSLKWKSAMSRIESFYEPSEE